MNNNKTYDKHFICSEFHFQRKKEMNHCYFLLKKKTYRFLQGMFIKSNPKAFPHAMKYLFTICDSTEFKKKFCWPIYNKAAEATFRYDKRF